MTGEPKIRFPEATQPDTDGWWPAAQWDTPGGLGDVSALPSLKDAGITHPPSAKMARPKVSVIKDDHIELLDPPASPKVTTTGANTAAEGADIAHPPMVVTPAHEDAPADETPDTPAAAEASEDKTGAIKVAFTKEESEAILRKGSQGVSRPVPNTADHEATDGHNLGTAQEPEAVGEAPAPGDESADSGQSSDTGKQPDVGNQPDAAQQPDAGQQPDTGNVETAAPKPDQSATAEGPTTTAEPPASAQTDHSDPAPKPAVAPERTPAATTQATPTAERVAAPTPEPAPAVPEVAKAAAPSAALARPAPAPKRPKQVASPRSTRVGTPEAPDAAFVFDPKTMPISPPAPSIPSDDTDSLIVESFTETDDHLAYSGPFSTVPPTSGGRWGQTAKERRQAKRFKQAIERNLDNSHAPLDVLFAEDRQAKPRRMALRPSFGRDLLVWIIAIIGVGQLLYRGWEILPTLNTFNTNISDFQIHAAMSLMVGGAVSAVLALIAVRFITGMRSAFAWMVSVFLVFGVFPWYGFGSQLSPTGLPPLPKPIDVVFNPVFDQNGVLGITLIGLAICAIVATMTALMVGTPKRY